MSYINRFTFKHSISFRLLERGFDYLTKINKVTIDGNLVHAEILGHQKYDVTCLIDFVNRRLIFSSCTCPYIKEHRHCKHLAALMLYLDLYINGGSVYELENFLIAEAIVGVLNNYDQLNIYPSINNLSSSVINNSIYKLNEYNHKTLYSSCLSKIDEKRFYEAMRLLERNKIIKISKDRIILLKNSIKTSYYYFFAKYSFMEGEEEDYIYNNGCYEKGMVDVYYSLPVKEKHDGIDIIYYSTMLKETNSINLYLDLENKNILDDFDIEDIDRFDRKNNIIPKVKLSSDFMAFIINTYEDSYTKNNLLDKLENNTLNQETFSNSIPNKSKYKFVENNYYIGKLLEICLLGNIWVNFPRPHNSSDYDYVY